MEIQMERSIPFKQLLVKEILANGPWRLHGSTGSTALVITELSLFLFNSLREDLALNNSKSFLKG